MTIPSLTAYHGYFWGLFRMDFPCPSRYGKLTNFQCPLSMTIDYWYRFVVLYWQRWHLYLSNLFQRKVPASMPSCIIWLDNRLFYLLRTIFVTCTKLKPIKFVCLWFYVQFKNVHSYFTHITSERLNILTYARHLWLLSSQGC